MRGIIRNQKGFEAVFVGVALLFVAVIGFAGYKVVSMNDPMDTASVAPAEQTGVPAMIKTEADLKATDKALEDSAAELDQDLDSSSLDDDLNSLL